MPGTIDNRSIEDVNPEDLAGYTRVGFFAGIGGWDLALQLAGWPEDKPIWHGSCPCQPFSSAGKGGGFDDERHLWPAFHHLIRVCRPAIVVGEQVASPDGLRWCDLVQDDLEMEGYAFGKADLCAAGVGAPHIRQRLYWVGRLAHATGSQEHKELEGSTEAQGGGSSDLPGGCGMVGRLGLPHSPGRQQGQPPSPPMGHGSPTEPAGGACGMAHGVIQGLEGHCGHGNNGDQSGRVGENEAGSVAEGGAVGGVENAGWTSPLRGFWRDADWLFCRDGKWRPVEPGSFPLANGVPKGMGLGSDPCLPIDPYSAEARVMRLKGYGNALTVQVAAAFLKAL